MLTATKAVKAAGNSSVADVTAAAAAASSTLPALPTLFPSTTSATLTHTQDVGSSSSYPPMPAPSNPIAAAPSAAAGHLHSPAVSKSYTRWTHRMELQLLTAIRANTRAHDDVLPSQCRTGVRDRSHKRWGEIASQVDSLPELGSQEDVGKKCSDKFNKLKKYIANGLENMFNVFQTAARELSIVEVAATGGSLASADLQLSDLMKHLTLATNSYGPSVLKWDEGFEPPAPYLARWREMENDNRELLELANLMKSVYEQAKSARHASKEDNTGGNNHHSSNANVAASSSGDHKHGMEVDEVVGAEEEKSMQTNLPPVSAPSQNRKRKFAQTGASTSAHRDHPSMSATFQGATTTDLLSPAALEQITSSLSTFISNKLATMVPTPPSQFRVKTPEEWFNSVSLTSKQIAAVKRILGSAPTLLLLAAIDEDLINDHASELNFTPVQTRAWKILSEEAKRAC